MSKGIASARVQATAEYKRRLRQDTGRLSCQACDWAPPDRCHNILHVHHLIPVCCGGTHRAENLILLCPNCHALAHALFGRSEGLYVGPRDREILRSILRDPEAHIEREDNLLLHLIDSARQGEEPPSPLSPSAPTDTPGQQLQSRRIGYVQMVGKPGWRKFRRTLYRARVDLTCDLCRKTIRREDRFTRGPGMTSHCSTCRPWEPMI